MPTKNSSKEGVTPQQIALIKQMLATAEKSINSIKKIIAGSTVQPVASKSDTRALKAKVKDLNVLEEGRVIEGVFDGQNMIGPDEKQYPIPPNYASKSKLVEGDILKLTIGDDGSFIFKQIGPIERNKLIGVVNKEDEDYLVTVDDKSYKVLMASITYFKAEADDEVTIVVPKDRESTWAAIENVIKKIDGSNVDDEEYEEDKEDEEDEDKEDEEDE